MRVNLWKLFLNQIQIVPKVLNIWLLSKHFGSLVGMSEPGEPEATTNRSLLWGRDFTRIFFVVFWNNRKLICLNLAVGVKKIPNLSMKNYTQFHSFSLIKRVKYEMISPFSRNEKWKIFSLHSFREVKVKIKWLKIEIEKWIFKKILENSRESRLSLVTGIPTKIN